VSFTTAGTRKQGGGWRRSLVPESLDNQQLHQLGVTRISSDVSPKTTMVETPSSSTRSAKSDPNPHISVYTHLPNFDNPDEALRLIHQIASMVRPIMRKRNWKVGTLAEFFPENASLQGPFPPYTCVDDRFERKLGQMDLRSSPSS
jgi:hypothetical protein